MCMNVCASNSINLDTYVWNCALGVKARRRLSVNFFKKHTQESGRVLLTSVSQVVLNESSRNRGKNVGCIAPFREETKPTSFACSSISLSNLCFQVYKKGNVQSKKR